MMYPGRSDDHMLPGYDRRIPDVQGIVLHVAVSESRWPSYRPGTAAHFYVRKDGSVGQQVDTSRRGGSNYQGNGRLLAVETQGGVRDPQGEPWTDAQVNALAALIRWAADVHKFPIGMMTTSSGHGVGWHRLGIRGNFPPGALSGLSQRGGGEQWSTAFGKVCPGNAKILQIPRIIELAGGAAPIGSAPVTPPVVDRNADGSLRLDVDGVRGPGTIGRWQEVMGTPVDGVISTPRSSLIAADQVFLNAVVAPDHIDALTGESALWVDGDEGPRTIRVRQFWLYNLHAPALLGRGARPGDFDGIDGPETTRLHQHALNHATARTGRY